tara:strand:+ start:129 stop:254 length:126 start_codon:yes stop_codon:yes gene_type:complete
MWLTVTLLAGLSWGFFMADFYIFSALAGGLVAARFCMGGKM